jgi:hypothetical protein
MLLWKVRCGKKILAAIVRCSCPGHVRSHCKRHAQGRVSDQKRENRSFFAAFPDTFRNMGLRKGSSKKHLVHGTRERIHFPKVCSGVRGVICCEWCRFFYFSSGHI